MWGATKGYHSYGIILSLKREPTRAHTTKGVYERANVYTLLSNPRSRSELLKIMKHKWVGKSICPWNWQNLLHTSKASWPTNSLPFLTIDLGLSRADLCIRQQRVLDLPVLHGSNRALMTMSVSLHHFRYSRSLTSAYCSLVPYVKTAKQSESSCGRRSDGFGSRVAA